jgi:hypothetical protein
MAGAVRRPSAFVGRTEEFITENGETKNGQGTKGNAENRTQRRRGAEANTEEINSGMKAGFEILSRVPRVGVLADLYSFGNHEAQVSTTATLYSQITSKRYNYPSSRSGDDERSEESREREHRATAASTSAFNGWATAGPNPMPRSFIRTAD